MAKVKFPLDMGNDIMVRNIDELKDNFNVEKVTEYFLNGKLLTWLSDRYYDEEAEQVEALSSVEDKSLLDSRLCNIFGIEIENKIDIEALEQRRERLEKLRSITSDDAVLKNIDRVAFSQEELGNLLDEDIDEIYLCGDKFRIPLSVKNKRYIGVNEPVVDISAKDDRIDLNEYGITIEKCSFSEKAQAKMKKKEEGIVEIKRAYIEDDYDLSEIIYNEEDENYNADEAIKADTRPYKNLNNDKVTGIIIPDGTKRIGACAFRGFKHLKTITIPDSVTFIGKYAFDYCQNLEDVKIPDGVITIEEDAFARCKSIEGVIIPESVTTLGRAAFCGCTKLKEIKLYCNIPEIREYTFSGCEDLTDIVISESVKEIGENAFYKCLGLSSIILPDSVVKICDYAFENCKNLTSVKFSENLTSIEYKAFVNCESLSSVILPDSVIEIGDSAFMDCTNLTEVKFSENLKCIKDWAFYECESLSSVILPDSVIEIGDFIFKDCTNLKQARLSPNLASTGNSTFDCCESLEMVEIPYGIKEIAFSSFSDTALTSLTIPESVPFESFFSISDIKTLKECNLPISYKKIIDEKIDNPYSDWMSFQFPEGCKINYYSSQQTAANANMGEEFSEEEKRRRLVKYIRRKTQSGDIGMTSFTWFFENEITSDAKRKVMNNVYGIDSSSSIIALYDQSFSTIFTSGCKGNGGLVFTTEGFAYYDNVFKLNTPLIHYSDFSFSTLSDGHLNIYTESDERYSFVFSDSNLDDTEFDSFIEEIADGSYLYD